MKHIYFIRHGESEMNAAGLIAGNTETPLTAKGRFQALEAGKTAKNLNIGCIISSPQSRALETAQIIAAEIGYPATDILVNDLAKERYFGELEGTKWSLNIDLSGVGGIEPAEILIGRAQSLLDWAKTLEPENILVVSHGAFGRALRSLLTSIAFDDRTVRSNNAEINQWL